jgi:hypothetical protein
LRSGPTRPQVEVEMTDMQGDKKMDTKSRLSCRRQRNLGWTPSVRLNAGARSFRDFLDKGYLLADEHYVSNRFKSFVRKNCGQRVTV